MRGGQAVRAVTLLHTYGNLVVICVGFHRYACLWLGGKRSREKEAARATLNAQRTHYGARPGPQLAPSVHAFPCVPRARKDPHPEEKNLPMRKKRVIHLISCHSVS